MATVLIVEDDLMIQDIFSACFEWGGIKVLLADNVQTAVNHLDTHPAIDVAIIGGRLKDGERGDHVAAHIVENMWPQQLRADRPLTPFVTVSMNPYHAPGATKSYFKVELLQMLVRQHDGGKGWIKEIKSATKCSPIKPEHKNPSPPFYAYNR